MTTNLNLSGVELEFSHDRSYHHATLLVDGVEVLFQNLRLPCGQILNMEQVLLCIRNKNVAHRRRSL